MGVQVLVIAEFDRSRYPGNALVFLRSYDVHGTKSSLGVRMKLILGTERLYRNPGFVSLAIAAVYAAQRRDSA